LVPSRSAYFLQKIPNIKVYGADTLTGAFDTLTTGDAECKHGTQNINGESLTLDGKEFFYTREFAHDFSDVKGQNIAKRAALIAAAGMHNILMEGSPGCGKSMIAKRLRYILPPMSVDEILKFAMLDFLEGKESDFSAKRPFRSPHNNSTRSALLGGGSKEGQIGEVALSSGGILWLDELPHFDKTLIEGLREPLENYRILISRVNSKIDYDADFMFVGSMNPCPCGNLLSKTKECRCKESEIQRYKNRLSEPFLDRMDIFVQMEEFSEAGKSDITSNEMFDNVIKAFSAQMKRGGKLNSRLSDKELAGLEITDEATDMLQKAGARFAMSARSSAKTLKVARTIADLENSIKVEKPHILEALSYRKRG
jgi:magnesium chelatase family protein